MQHRKKREAGRDERIEVLIRHLPNIADHVASRPSGAGIDDLLDAAVYPFQTQNTGKVASDIESPWSKSVGVPMLLDVRHLAVGFLRSKEPGKVFPYAEIAVHFYESVAVLGHEAPKHRSLLCAAHHPMLAFNRAKRRSVYTLKLTVCRLLFLNKIRKGLPVNHSESCFYLFSWTKLAALPRWRTGRGVACHKLVGHAEQVPQYIQIDARQANQHAVIADVVVRHIINIGVRSEQFSPIIKIHGNDKRTRFGRAMSRDTRQEFSTDLECRGPVRGAVLDAGQSKSDLPYRVEVDCPSRHWFRTHCRPDARAR